MNDYYMYESQYSGIGTYSLFVSILYIASIVIGIMMFIKMWKMANKVNDLFSIIKEKSSDDSRMLYLISQSLNNIEKNTDKPKEELETKKTGKEDKTAHSDIEKNGFYEGESVLRVCDNEVMVIEEIRTDGMYRCSLVRDGRMQSVYSKHEIRKS